MNAAKRREIFERLRDANPSPTTELDYSGPFELLIAVMLSAQATDVSVNKATRSLFPAASTPEAMLALGEDGVRSHIHNIGLFNAKAKNVIATCRLLLDHHGGEVPCEREALERLPGVGRKTANVVLNTAFGIPVIRGRYPYLPRRQPDPARPRQDPAPSRGRAGALDPQRVQARRPPLADPARPVRVHGAQAGLRTLPHRRSLRIPAQGPGTVTSAPIQRPWSVWSSADPAWPACMHGAWESGCRTIRPAAPGLRGLTACRQE